MSVAQIAPFPSHVERPASPNGARPALHAINPASPPPRLLDRVRQALQTRHYSRRTIKAYVGWIRRYSSTAKSSKQNLPWLDDLVRAKRPEHLPVVMTRDEVRAVLQHLDGVPRLLALLF